jgi:RNA polymerase sigma-70 factor (family 1)
MDCFITYRASTSATPDRLFCQLYQKYQSLIHSYLHDLTRDNHAAEDLTHDIFSKLWSQQSLLHTMQNPEAYLFRMARNEGISYLRHQKIIKRSAAHIHNHTTEELTLNMVHSRELERALQLAIQQLTPHQKRIYILSKLQGWKRQKIAQTLGISPSTVKELLRRAIHEVRKRVGGNVETL